MRGLTKEERSLLAVVARDTGRVCDVDCTDEEDANGGAYDDELVVRLLGRKLIVVFTCPCGDDHSDVTPIGRIALRLPVNL